MNRFFSNVKEHCDNLYIADYTLHSHGLKKVIISETVFTDIDFFGINNPQKHRFYSVNFEENALMDEERKKIRQCECLCASKETDGWVCFLELKYCNKDNIRKNSLDAYRQLESTYNHLNNKGILCNRKNIYLIFSIPEHNRAPFENFIFTPNKLHNIRRTKGYIVRGINRIEIADKNKIV